MNLKGPFNIKAQVVFIPSEFENLKINGETISKFKRNKVDVISNEVAIFGSRNYQIEYLKS